MLYCAYLLSYCKERKKLRKQELPGWLKTSVVFAGPASHCLSALSKDMSKIQTVRAGVRKCSPKAKGRGRESHSFGCIWSKKHHTFVLSYTNLDYITNNFETKNKMIYMDRFQFQKYFLKIKSVKVTLSSTQIQF